MTEKIVFKTGLTGAGQDGIYLAAGSPGAGGAGGDGGSNGAAGSPGLVRLIFVLPTGSPPPLRCQGCKTAGWRGAADVRPHHADGHTSDQPSRAAAATRAAHAQDSVACANWRPARVCSSPEEVIDVPPSCHDKLQTESRHAACSACRQRPANFFRSNEVLISSG